MGIKSMKHRMWIGVVACCATMTVQAENFVVTNTLPSGPGSLANALAVAATNAAGNDVISFAIPGTPPFIISPTSALPELTGFTLVDGTTQAGFSNHHPVIVVDGSLITNVGVHGFTTRGPSNVIRGLHIQKFTGSGVRMNDIGGNAQFNRVEGCIAISNGFYGIQLSSVSNNVVGGLAASNRNVTSGNTAGGIAVDGGRGNMVAGNWVGVNATNSAQKMTGQSLGINLIGTWSNTIASSPTAPQVISGNNSYGLRISGGGSNVVYGNYIGCDATAMLAVSNGASSVLIADSVGNRIGGNTASQRNFVSGNGTSYGFDLFQTHQNVIEGNFIGVNATGLSALPNLNGLRLQLGASNNVVGGSTPGTGNIISGNTAGGLSVNGTGNRIEGNSIGLAFDYVTLLPNGGTAVIVSGTNHVIGGAVPTARNVIAGGAYGVWLDFAVACSVQNNYIGVDVNGARKPNTVGVYLSNARNCLIGGPGAGNVISGNTQNGIYMSPAPFGNIIQGNFIGTTLNGLSSLSNGFHGIHAVSGTNNVIGGTAPGSGNVIAGNAIENVRLDPTTRGFTIAGNYIGVGADGMTSFPSAEFRPGLQISGADHLIGGTAVGAGNVISGNPRTGINIVSATNITVQGNYIGLAANGVTPVPNGADISSYGVHLNVGSTRSQVGGTTEGARNVMAGHYREVHISQSDSNTVAGNYLGYIASGLSMVPQTSHAVSIDPGSWNTIGGTSPGAGNLLYGQLAAVTIVTTNSRHNTVAGNIVNLNRLGDIATTNLQTGILIAQARSNLIGGVGAPSRNIILAGGNNG
ncbi:MAG TPA: hypothetical protein PJ991_11595, partial [Kiritimatiellia bacterium]|nr:hypothetical protein [Kiritimatiellia bacterium]